MGQFFGEGDGDAAGAGADVGYDEAQSVVFVGAASAKFAESKAVECDFDEMLGFGARNQDVRCDLEGEAPEFLFAGEMLDGDAGDAAIEERLISAFFLVSQFSFGAGIEIRAFPLRGMKEQKFRRERVGGNVRRAKLRDAVFECGAKIHGK